MGRQAIPRDIERKLYSESGGKCMNPDCKQDLFMNDGNIAEKAHITPHCKTADNSFENLIILCPNCHTNFDKNSSYNEDEVKTWKAKRQEELSILFSKKFNTFDDLEENIKPILKENEMIYEKYYLSEKSQLWKKFEVTILANNHKLKLILNKNRNLLQKHSQKEYSNLAVIDDFIAHINEFESTREDKEKTRSILFPEKINSIFGIKSINYSLIPSSESLECLIQKLRNSNCFIKVSLDTDSPYIEFNSNKTIEILYLTDIPRLRQIYDKYDCFRKIGLRLDSLTFILKWLKNNDIEYEFPNISDLSNIKIKGKLFKFIYEYCLSRSELISLAPIKGLFIFNLHRFNGEECISKEAYEQAEIMEVKLLIHDTFFRYIHRM